MNDDVNYNTPDPVAVHAAQYALEVTDTIVAHPTRNRLITLFLSLFIIIGAFGAVIGTLNTVALTHQNSIVNDQQKCQTVLLRAITEEQDARAKISSDDRTALSDFVHGIGTATSSAQIQAAKAKFDAQTAANNKKRAQYPVPTFTHDVCETKAGQDTVNKSIMPSPAHK